MNPIETRVEDFPVGVFCFGYNTYMPLPEIESTSSDEYALDNEPSGTHRREEARSKNVGYRYWDEILGYVTVPSPPLHPHRLHPPSEDEVSETERLFRQGFSYDNDPFGHSYSKPPRE